MKYNSKTFLGLSNEQLNKFICPILLATCVFFASLYTFHRASAFVLSVIYLVASTCLFNFFDKLSKKKNGVLIYTAILVAVLFISIALVAIYSASAGYRAPMRWFYALDDDESFNPLMALAMSLGGGFFLTSIIYYFTMIRYRTMGVMLCTMFPFFFFSKRSDTMPDILTTVIMLLILAVIIHNKRLDFSVKGKTQTHLKIDRAYIICLSIFILITGAITMTVDKPYYQSFLEKNSRYLTPFGFGGGTSGFEELSDKSSARNGSPSYTYEPLFYMETNSDQSEIYLRNKSFDLFNGDVWVNSNPDSWIYYNSMNTEYSTNDVISDIAILENKDFKSLHSVRSAYIFDDDFAPRHLPSPYGIITDNMPASSVIYYKMVADTAVYRSSAYYYPTALNDRIVFHQQENGLNSFAHELNFNSQEYKNYLSSFNESAEAKRLLDDYTNAIESYTDTSNISDELTKLSLQIVENSHSDIEKAERLESYFAENGFKYSLEYKPTDNSIDYFVFESKTGYCTNYATAMTLMARSLGLPARYVEGFAAFEKNEEGQFVIRDGYAHAFVEVYIPGAGWVTFDPTVSDYKDRPANSLVQNGFGFISKLLYRLNKISAIIVIAVIVIFFSLFNKIREFFVRLFIRFKPNNEKIITLYNNLIRWIGIYEGKDYSGYTPNMLKEYLNGKGFSPINLISLFEKVAFGGYKCNKEEYKLAYKEYKKAYKKISHTSKRPL